ncbi:hypothetical protein EJB05_57009, partial [Eragrostis curvula]
MDPGPPREHASSRAHLCAPSPGTVAAAHLTDSSTLRAGGPPPPACAAPSHPAPVRRLPPHGPPSAARRQQRLQALPVVSPRDAYPWLVDIKLRKDADAPLSEEKARLVICTFRKETLIDVQQEDLAQFAFPSSKV